MICFHLITFLIGFLITKSFLKEIENIFLIFSFWYSNRNIPDVYTNDVQYK